MDTVTRTSQTSQTQTLYRYDTDTDTTVTTYYDACDTCIMFVSVTVISVPVSNTICVHILYDIHCYTVTIII